MPDPLPALQVALAEAFGERVRSSLLDRGQLTIVVAPEDLIAVCTVLRDDERMAFTTLIDLIGMDYQGHAGSPGEGARFAVVYNLLSIRHNQRVRVKCLAASEDFPSFESVIGVWPAANWFEREAFDLYGIVFQGHPDLRRILTDYGFVGHPFRKDFPVSGYVEMIYDPVQKRVVYQPVSIEPREIVPRVVREDTYGEAGKI